MIFIKDHKKINHRGISIIPEVFVSIVSIIGGIIIFVSRIGFENYGQLILEGIFVSFFLIYTPHVVSTIILKQNNIDWYNSKPFILLLSLVLLVSVSEIGGLYDYSLSIFVGLIGSLFCILTIVDSIKNKYAPSGLLLFVIFALFGIFFTTAYYSDFYFHPLIKEKIITGAWAHRDSLWFSSMAGMYKTYGVSSNGLDGLVPVYYHNLSHYVYGALSNLLGISTLTFFHLVVPIIITPMYLLTFLFCINEVNQYYSTQIDIKKLDNSKKEFWLLFAILFLLPLPYQIINKFGGDTYQYIMSSSYNFALTLTFILISIIFSFINNHKDEKIPVYLIIIYVITIVGLYLAISISKVSFLFVIGSIYGYVFLRLKYYTNIFHIICMTAFLLVVATVYVNLLNTETFLKNPYQIVSSDISFVSYIFYIYPSLIYVFLKLYSINVRKFSDFVLKIKSNSLLDIEILFFLMVILLPLTYQYFKGIQIYFVYILIMSHFGLFKSNIFKTEIFFNESDA